MPGDRVLPARQPQLDEPRAAVLVRLPVEGERVGGRAEIARGELVERLDRARVLERLPFALRSEDLVDHAASRTDRTQAEFSRALRRRSRRSSVLGPCPVTTLISSSQSGSV